MGNQVDEPGIWPTGPNTHSWRVRKGHLAVTYRPMVIIMTLIYPYRISLSTPLLDHWFSIANGFVYLRENFGGKLFIGDISL